MEPRRSSVSPLRTRERSRTLGLRKTTHGSRIGRCYILNCLKPQLRSWLLIAEVFSPDRILANHSCGPQKLCATLLGSMLLHPGFCQAAGNRLNFLHETSHYFAQSTS